MRADVIIIVVVVSRSGTVLFFSPLDARTCPTWAALRICGRPGVEIWSSRSNGSTTLKRQRAAASCKISR